MSVFEHFKKLCLHLRNINHSWEDPRIPFWALGKGDVAVGCEEGFQPFVVFGFDEESNVPGNVVGKNYELRFDLPRLKDKRPSCRLVYHGPDREDYHKEFGRFCDEAIQKFDGDVSKLASFVELRRDFNESYSVPDKKQVQGWWGELFTIYHSRVPLETVKFWHMTSAQRWDFESQNLILEVKSTTKEAVRSHQIKRWQCIPEEGKELFIASVQTRDDENGWNLKKLYEETLAISDSQSFRQRLEACVQNLVLSKCPWRYISEFKFDIELAKRSLRFYHSSLIDPIQEESIPREIDPRSIEFVLDMTGFEIHNKERLLSFERTLEIFLPKNYLKK